MKTVPSTASLPSCVAHRCGVPCHENPGDIAHVDGNAVVIAHDNFIDVLQACNLPGAADEVLLAVPFDVTRADAGVVVGQRRHQIAKGQAIGAQLVGCGVT